DVFEGLAGQVLQCGCVQRGAPLVRFVIGCGRGIRPRGTAGGCRYRLPHQDAAVLLVVRRSAAAPAPVRRTARAYRLAIPECAPPGCLPAPPHRARDAAPAPPAPAPAPAFAALRAS